MLDQSCSLRLCRYFDLLHEKEGNGNPFIPDTSTRAETSSWTLLAVHMVHYVRHSADDLPTPTLTMAELDKECDSSCTGSSYKSKTKAIAGLECTGCLGPIRQMDPKLVPIRPENVKVDVLVGCLAHRINAIILRPKKRKKRLRRMFAKLSK